MAASDPTSLCAHSPCECSPADGSKYCGPYCETAVTGGHHESGDGCGCGHPECAPLEGVPDSAIGGG